jgi:hypothetical protein
MGIASSCPHFADSKFSSHLHPASKNHFCLCRKGTIHSRLLAHIHLISNSQEASLHAEPYRALQPLILPCYLPCYSCTLAGSTQLDMDNFSSEQESQSYFQFLSFQQFLLLDLTFGFLLVVSVIRTTTAMIDILVIHLGRSISLQEQG